MESYIGTKIIRAMPMDDATYMMKGRGSADLASVTVDSDGKGRPGYLVEYPDGYRSWSPKDVFEAAYRRITDGEIDMIARALEMPGDA